VLVPCLKNPRNSATQEPSSLTLFVKPHCSGYTTNIRSWSHSVPALCEPNRRKTRMERLHSDQLRNQTHPKVTMVFCFGQKCCPCIVRILYHRQPPSLSAPPRSNLSLQPHQSDGRVGHTLALPHHGRVSN
jgi:hypothetical protein